ncbi:hypothetical protein PUN28_019822 [Cardiocondyla obscurior]|uniref:Uncharacterized protein n=1 Tax=Cardiocondyla obscurior TaxID=286306 RepID=A0AAW2E7P5_9HYME
MYEGRKKINLIKSLREASLHAQKRPSTVSSDDDNSGQLHKCRERCRRWYARISRSILASTCPAR